MKGYAEGQERYKYYSFLMPVDIGTAPDDADNPMITFTNYDCDARIPVKQEDFCAWGEVIYGQALTEKQLAKYELRPSRFNPDIKEKIYAQTQEVGEWETKNNIDATERITWWYPDNGFFVLKDTCSIDRLAEHHRIILLYNQIMSEKPESCPDPLTLF